MHIKDKLDFNTKPKSISFAPEVSVQQALEVMCAKNIGSIIVVNPDETIAGIVTERDLMIRVLGAKLDPEKTNLAQIMTTEVRVAQADDDLVDWMQTMSNERFRHLPIVDDKGRLINMMSQGDFLAHTWPDLYDKIKQDLRGGFGRYAQVSLIVFAVVTLGLIAFNF